MGFFVFPSITIYPLRLFSSISVQRIFVGGDKPNQGGALIAEKILPPSGPGRRFTRGGRGFPEPIDFYD